MARQERTAARRLLIRRLLEQHTVGDQAALAALLRGQGHRVSQTTISRDLAALGAYKGEDDGRYRIGGDADGTDDAARELGRRMREFALDISASANLVVVHTPPGSAHALGVAVDIATGPRGALAEALGCVAGDDTLLVVARSVTGGAALARRLRALMEART